MSNPFFAGPDKGENTTTECYDPRYDGIKRVAKYQRWVLFAVLANIILHILFIIIRMNSALPALAYAANILALIVILFSMLAMYVLARELFGIGVAFACAILTFVPLAGLISLLVVNQKATTYLQRRGVHVGLMGADPNGI